MRKFLSLPQEKQEKIVTAAMTFFGNVGYKKAYISEIAKSAGISKSLIFHYFGSKKGLYSYLVYYTGKVVLTEAQEKRETEGKIFFERALATIKFRLSLKSRYPAMDAFIDSVYNEDDEEVAEDIERLLAIATDMHAKISLTSEELKLFREGVDADLVIDLVSKYSDGLLCSFGEGKTVEEAAGEAAQILGMLEMMCFE